MIDNTKIGREALYSATRTTPTISRSIGRHRQMDVEDIAMLNGAAEDTQEALTALDNLYEKAALIEVVEALKLDVAPERSCIGSPYKLAQRKHAETANAALDAVLKAIRGEE